jgi:hypothetical protein
MTEPSGEVKTVPLTQEIDKRMQEVARELKDEDLLDAAALLAARHSGLEGEASELRSWLALLAIRTQIAHQLGGGPRHVIDEMEHSAMLQARLRGESVDTIWREAMVESRDAASALDARAGNREKVRQYRQRSWLLGLPWGRGYLYPAFQFDVERRTVFPEVRRVNELLRAVDDPWGVASWWISLHARLGERPMDLIGTGRADDLVEAAQALVEQIG